MMARIFTLALALFTITACDSEAGMNERKALRERDAPRARRIVREDITKTQIGVRRAAELFRRGFLVEDTELRERQMRSVLRRIQEPPRGIPELTISATSFVACVGTDGKVIARDSDPDPMRGFDLGEAAPVVRRALASGEAAWELSELPSLIENDPPSVTILFVHPSVHEGRVVGAVVAGLPLYRMAQQISSQIQLEDAPQMQAGAQAFTLFYYGDENHYHADFPENILGAVPDGEQRASGLSGRERGGYTGEFEQFGRWYGFAVIPLPYIGDDVGMVMFRSDPM
jgi:hypothetical protein